MYPPIACNNFGLNYGTTVICSLQCVEWSCPKHYVIRVSTIDQPHQPECTGKSHWPMRSIPIESDFNKIFSNLKLFSDWSSPTSAEIWFYYGCTFLSAKIQWILGRLVQIVLGNFLATFCGWSNFLWDQQLRKFPVFRMQIAAFINGWDYIYVQNEKMGKT